MSFRVLFSVLFVVLTLSLGACGGGGSSSTPSNPTPTAQPTSEPTPTPEPSSEPSPSPSPEPSDAGTLIINPNLSAASFWAGDDGDSGAVGSRELISVEHEAFDQAVRISVQSPTGEFWNGQLQFPASIAVSEGDVVLVHFYMRSVANTYETGAGFTTVFLEDNSTYEKYLARETTATDEWLEYYLPATISDSQASGNLALKFGFGAGDRAQVFDLAGIELLYYGDYDIELLPATLPSYGGRDANAPWRASADARIEQHRKVDFELTVLNASGQPASDASVDIQFEKHAYHFGSVTVGNILMGSSSDSTTYKEKVLELFNQSGPENDLKWAPWIGEWGNAFNQQQTLAGLQWLRDNGLYTRGHVMVWPARRNLPNFIQALIPEADPANADASVEQEVLDHIDDIATATANYVDEWDVLNEPYDNHDLMDAFGNSVMVDWFVRARSHLATHGLYLNDYSILSAGGRNTAHQDHFQQTIQYLLDNQAPITGIGMQSHMGATPTDIDRVYAILERFHTAFPSLDIRSTEFDINTLDEQLQAEYTRDFLTIFFSHPATVGVQLWGFWAGAHWAPNAAMYDTDWREKPMAVAWKNRIYTDWWNDFTGTTNSQGRYAERGFYGDYSVSITLGEETRHFEFTLQAGGESDFTFSFAD